MMMMMMMVIILLIILLLMMNLARGIRSPSHAVVFESIYATFRFFFCVRWSSQVKSSCQLTIN
jgi:hypothetical protein